jgi:tripartite-type tricarboxylate transporter receptor subunit TctC
MMFRKFFCSLAVGLVATVTAPHTMAADYPNKPVKIYVGYTPGTPPDIVARLLAPRLEKVLSQPFVVENKPGTQGILAEDFVARSKADGYSLLASANIFAINAALKDGYKGHKTLRPVAVLALHPVYLFSHADSPYKTLKDVIDAAKAKPGTITFGTTGVGGNAHMAAELLMNSAGIKLLHVPYKGSGEILQALLGRELDLRLGAYIVSDPRVHPIVVMDAKRTKLAPDVPAIPEFGISGFFDTFTTTVLSAPADTPNEVIDLLYKKVAEVFVESPELNKQLATIGAEIHILSPQESQKRMDELTTQWTEIVSKLGLKTQ